MKPKKFLGLILIVLGLAVLFYNLVLIGGIIAFLGLVIFLIPTKRITKKRVINEFQHKMHALSLNQKEKALKKKQEALKRARDRHVRHARR
jgi:uncharacterized membrane protein (DUF106 family)